MAFPRIRLRSGIGHGRVTDALHQNGTLSGNLTGPRVFITAFITKNFSTIFQKVNPISSKNRILPGNGPSKFLFFPAVTEGNRKRKIPHGSTDFVNICNELSFSSTLHDRRRQVSALSR